VSILCSSRECKFVEKLTLPRSVNAYFRVGQEPADAQERAFKMGAIGLADSLGILAASLVAMPTEISLCHAQVARGHLLCQDL
jgi:battenin